VSPKDGPRPSAATAEEAAAASAEEEEGEEEEEEEDEDEEEDADVALHVWIEGAEDAAIQTGFGTRRGADVRRRQRCLRRRVKNADGAQKSVGAPGARHQLNARLLTQRAGR